MLTNGEKDKVFKEKFKDEKFVIKFIKEVWKKEATKEDVEYVRKKPHSYEWQYKRFKEYI